MKKEVKQKLIVYANPNCILKKGENYAYLNFELDKDKFLHNSITRGTDYIEIPILFKTKETCFESLIKISNSNHDFQADYEESRDLIEITHISEGDHNFSMDYEYEIVLKINYLNDYAVLVQLI